jgi:ERCC4-type nuclease
MRIVIDSREHALYEKCREILSKQTFIFKLVLVQQELKIGDILIQTPDENDILLIERKSFADLLSSIKDGRYEEQSHRLLNTSNLPPHSIIYLLEGMFSQVYNPRDKQVIYSAMTSMNYFKGFSVYRVSSTQEAAEWLLFTAAKIDKELERGKWPYYYSTPFMNIFQIRQEKRATMFISDNASRNDNYVDCVRPANFIVPDQDSENKLVETPNIETQPPNYCNFVKKVKKDNITPENIGEIMLCQIPGISSVTAIAIMKQFGTFPKLIQALQENPQCLDGMACETANGKSRKISKSSIENIHKFFIGKET